MADYLRERGALNQCLAAPDQEPVPAADPAATKVLSAQEVAAQPDKHAFARLTFPSKCMHCKRACYLNSVVCSKCGLACHKKCTNKLTVRLWGERGRGRGCCVWWEVGLVSPWFSCLLSRSAAHGVVADAASFSRPLPKNACSPSTEGKGKSQAKTVFGTALDAQDPAYVVDNTPLLLRRISEAIERRGMDVEVRERGGLVEEGCVRDGGSGEQAQTLGKTMPTTLGREQCHSPATYPRRRLPLAGNIPPEQRQVARRASLRALRVQPQRDESR